MSFFTFIRELLAGKQRKGTRTGHRRNIHRARDIRNPDHSKTSNMTSPSREFAQSHNSSEELLPPSDLIDPSMLRDERASSGSASSQTRTRPPSYDSGLAVAAAALDRILFIDTFLDRDSVCDVIDGLGEAFYHIPFAVCGVAAMVYYGYERFTLNRISIVCPTASAEVILCWARSRDMYQFAKDPTTFGYRTETGRICPVRVRTQDTGTFEEFAIVRLGNHKSPVLTLPCLINQFAKDYMEKLDAITPDMQARYARDIMWMLTKMGELGGPEQMFTPKHASWVLCRGFWLPFTLSFPDTIDAFSGAGLFSCYTDGDERTDTADSESSDTYAPAAWTALHGHYAKQSTSSPSPPDSESGTESATPLSSEDYFSAVAGKCAKHAPSLNKPLPHLPKEAYQPPLVPGRIYAKGFPDLSKPLPPLPAEAFDTEPPVRSNKSFAARMVARVKETIWSSPSAPSRNRRGVPVNLVPALVLTREQKSPPALRRVKHVRFDKSADKKGSSCSTALPYDGVFDA